MNYEARFFAIMKYCFHYTDTGTFYNWSRNVFGVYPVCFLKNREK